MNSGNNLKSGQKKLSMQMLILVTVIILIAAVGLLMIKSSSGGFLGGSSTASQLSAKLLKDINLTQTNLYKIQSMVQSNQDKKEIENFSDQQQAMINQSIAEVKKALESDVTAEQKKFYQGIMSNLTEYQKAAVRFMKLAPAGTGAAYLSAANEKMESISDLLTQLSMMEGKTGEQGAGSDGFPFYAVLIALALVMIVSVFLIPAMIKSVMNHHVVEPLQETASVLRDFSGGKFNKQLVWDADDAIGELVQTVNVLRTKMNAPSAVPAPKPASSEPASAAKATPAPSADENTKTLSGMIKKTQDQDNLVLSSKKAIDKLQDI